MVKPYVCYCYGSKGKPRRFRLWFTMIKTLFIVWYKKGFKLLEFRVKPYIKYIPGRKTWEIYCRVL